MTTEQDTLKKFLASDDPEMVMMGLAMVKGMKGEIAAEMLDIPFIF